ncbi:hypothetical protein NA56DRAFT_690619 [Hyaloscypha hepaticicola]|uniref:Uncharacterized protein n=1 Tax=Hyaloscypha hepaticicola TaxID=2082293 RepID=A0A2J6PZ30_9HELO|nr:hypothetical protein NA56DRAFT_690619 [Hyaloscypha hepaticicola]
MQGKMYAQSEPARQSNLYLQQAVLRHLPTPVVALSTSRKAVFFNRAAGRVIGSPDTLQTSTNILGQEPVELGIKLLHNLTWKVVLDELVEAQKDAISTGTDCPVHEVDAVISNTNLTCDERNFRILVSILTADDGNYFLLSFERSAQTEKKAMSGGEDQISSNDEHPVLPTMVRHDTVIDGGRDINRIKKAVFDSSNVMGFILTVDEKFYLANKKTREVLGDVMGEAEGCDGLSLREEVDIWDENFMRLLEPAEFPGMTLVRARKPFTNHRYGFTHTKTGDRIVMNISGECLYDDDTGEFLGGICWCRGLQKYSEFLSDQQQRTLESHETICNLMPHLVWTTTTCGSCDWFSQRWYDFTGMSREESLGSGFQNAIHPDDLPVLMDKWEQHRKLGNECEVEIRYRRKDGVYKWMLARACPFKDESGKILKWYGTNTDIHDLVMARIEAARNKLQILTVLAHAEVNLFSINKHRIVTLAEGGMLWDSEAESYDIHNKSTMVGKDAIEISQQTQPGGVPGYEKNVIDVLSGKVGVAQSEDKIGDRVFRTRVVAELEHNSCDGGQKPKVKGCLGLSIDITDMKARAALELDNARLTMEEQAAKDSNRVKSQFLANGVIGMVELLSEDPNLTPEQKEYVNSIQLSAKALLTIVNDVLDFSKIESGRLDIEEVPFNLALIVGELCKMLSMFACQKGLKFSYENTMDKDLELLGDPGRTRQVLSNLLTNALKFTKEGTVHLSVSARPMSPQVIGDEILEVQFIIEDTGIGIEKHVLDKLFRPFSQGDSSTARLYGGTGLGLTISKYLASLMKGSITLQSTPGVGSKAIFTVPLKVSSYCRNPRLDSSTWSPPHPGFRLSERTGLTLTPTWSQNLARRSINQDLVNQQISNCVADYPPLPSPPIDRSLRHSSIETLNSSLPLTLSPEQRSKVHVLVVEDNAINQTIAIKNIRKLGFPVTAVWNGREALSYLLSPSPSQPRPSIILMDVQMPVMDGYEATRILRTGREYSLEVGTGDENNMLGVGRREDDGEKIGIGRRLSDIPVIAMTASAIQGDREKCHEAGMDDYLAKPVEKARLEEMLVKWANRRRG